MRRAVHFCIRNLSSQAAFTLGENYVIPEERTMKAVAVSFAIILSVVRAVCA
jgi:hypothetical protein